ncbi:MAG TPA: RraA family protein [Anaerolineae bacterium]|nr:RraA family protein [Anaerolineae bacterium]
MSISLDELIARYERLGTADVYDILDQMGYPNQALSSEIRALAPNMLVAGPAYTVQGRSYRADAPSQASSYQMFREIVPQSVLIMAMDGHRISGPWGENSSISAQMRGARGAVLDGATRDLNAIVALGFSTFARAVTPVFSQGRYEIVSWQQPIKMSGQVQSEVTVHPGDFVLADNDGVVIIPAAVIQDVLLAAERLAEIEQEIRVGLRSGQDRESVYMRLPKFDHIRKVNKP